MFTVIFPIPTIFPSLLNSTVTIFHDYPTDIMPILNEQALQLYIFYPHSKVGDGSRGRLEGSFFNSYYAEV